MKRAIPLQQEISFDALDPQRIRMESARKKALDLGRTRLLVTGVMFALAFSVLGARLVDLSRHGKEGVPKWRTAAQAEIAPHVVARGNVLDRDGLILATSLPTQSLYVDPLEAYGAVDPVEAADQLISVLPNLNREQIIERMNKQGHFEWVARNLTPEQVWAVNRLGLPGFGFRDEERRVYPFGPTFAHVLGYTDTDGRGISGIEQEFEHRLGAEGEPVTLSLDLRVQAILHDELIRTKANFEALGTAGVVMDVNTGEILAMASLPDFDPNQPGSARGESGFNRATKGVYEMGSTFKLFTTAMALDSGAASLTDGYDATNPIQIARFTITDFHGKKRWLSVPEILTYSSNIGTAKMALDVGATRQKDYLARFGLLEASKVELPEVGGPLYPARWSDISTMTIAYGHGIAVSPLQLVTGVSALVNGGVMRQPTLIKVADPDQPRGTQVISEKTSASMRALMRKVVRDGTGEAANIPGYLVGGKTGTADKQVGGGYDKNARISSFIGVFPMTAPRYVVLVVVDEPKGTKETFGYATGGWVAAPAVGNVISRIGPLFGLAPDQSSAVAEIEVGHPMYLPEAKAPRSTARIDGNGNVVGSISDVAY
ncbi:MAG: penicillin-binding protein 2 [Rhodospirillales bacterium]|nr:penicillin-binding protein 2 [Rhodospirillales bacterium]